MRRRQFITLFGGLGAVTVWPIAGRAQQSAISTIGYFSTRSPGEAKHVTDAFIRGLSESGYVEGRNLARSSGRLGLRRGSRSRSPLRSDQPARQRLRLLPWGMRTRETRYSDGFTALARLGGFDPGREIFRALSS